MRLGAVLGILARYDDALALLALAAEQYRRLDDVAGEMRIGTFFRLPSDQPTPGLWGGLYRIWAPATSKWAS
jgi:hypothetical protein